MFPLQCIILSEKCCGKNAEAAETGQFFQLVSVFQCTLTHSRAAHAAHQAVTIKVRVCNVHVYKSSILACIVLAVASICKILWKSMVFLDLF
jgi:hypothetical protein